MKSRDYLCDIVNKGVSSWRDKAMIVKSRDYLYDIVNMRDEEEEEEEESLEQLSQWITEN